MVDIISYLNDLGYEQREGAFISDLTNYPVMYTIENGVLYEVKFKVITSYGIDDIVISIKAKNYSNKIFMPLIDFYNFGILDNLKKLRYMYYDHLQNQINNHENK